MLVNTRIFGEIDIDEAKIITMENGIIGFPDLKKFALVYDEEKKGESSISWLQSLDEGAFAIPVMNPTVVKEDYNPFVEEELLKPLGTVTPENLCVLVSVKVPQDITQMSVNLKAPFVVNVDTRIGVQLIVEDDYPVRYEIYELLKSKKVAVVPGSAFGSCGEGFIRCSYATSMEGIKEAMAAMKEFVKEIKS